MNNMKLDHSKLLGFRLRCLDAASVTSLKMGVKGGITVGIKGGDPTPAGTRDL